MTGFLHRLLACLFVLSLLTGGLPARATPAATAAMAMPGAAHGHAQVAEATGSDCHGDAGAAHDMAGDGTHDCCGSDADDDSRGCDQACACPLAAAAVSPAVARHTAAVMHAPRASASARGDPGRAPAPPRRPPIG